MAPQNDDLIVSRFDRLEERLDSWRKEMMALFVLKEVFDTTMAARDKEFAELKKDFNEHRQAEMGKWMRYILVAGGILGLVTSLFTILQHFHL